MLSMMTQPHQLLLLILLLCSAFLTTESSPSAEQVCDAESGTCLNVDEANLALKYAKTLVQELKTLSGGFFSDKLEVRRKNPRDPTSKIGLFATKDIEAKELLLSFPQEALIRITPTDNWEDDICDLKELFLKEVKMGQESVFSTYVAFLQEIDAGGEIPSSWSRKGKLLLEDMLYSEDIDDSLSLPPHDATTLLGLECYDEYDDGYDEDDKFAMLVTITKGWDTALTPVYDFIGHDNNMINTENTSINARKGFLVKASKAIKKGGELFYSFDRCIDCGNTVEQGLGTPEIFRDLGTIESYPQRFYFAGDEVMPDMTIYVDKGEDGSLSGRFMFGDEPIYGSYHGGIRFMKEHLERLVNFKTDELFAERKSLPDFEYQMINRYLDTLVDVLTLGTKLGESAYIEPEIFLHQKYNTETEYVLPEETEVIGLLDNHRRIIYQAETLVYNSSHYEAMEPFESQYQLIEHFWDPETGDVCFNLDSIFQMCTCYWPYYHEVQVHKAAKYIKEDIKRVLFVGAGDNGLLNEIIKYPSLELVVGLELDQHVARLAFKHFGSRTHYHDEKVQWWYGDASKTLFMLPKEYFGSFDMVLVDLSDTIFALSVSDELDVVGALSLLLRPGGIFAMNELFFKKVSDVFKYSLYYQFYDIPKLGDQGFVFASNDVDLLNQDLTNHKIDGNLVEDTILRTEHQFHYVHDYRHNPSSTFEKICKNKSKETEELELQQTSPGIFMVLEAEDLKSNHLGSVTKLRNTIEKALKKESLQVISSSNGSDSSSMFVTVFKEGYVVARIFSEERYVAFDILLWSSFEKFEAVKAALVQSVGGEMKSASSFRIVTGGMFGVNLWQEDTKSHGPQISKLCKEDKTPIRGSPSSPDVFGVALEGSLSLVQSESSFAVGVLCGSEGSICESAELLKNNDMVSKVVPLYACSGLDSVEELQACSVNSAIEKLEKTQVKIKCVVVDRASTTVMDGVLGAMSEEDLLEDNLYAVAAIDSHKDLWRRKTVDRVRTKITRTDPVFRAHVLFNSTESSLELAIASSGDKFFIERLKDVVATMEEKSGHTLEIRNIIGGQWKLEPHYIVEDNEGSKFFLQEDFNSTSAADQYNSQHPIGSQSISQYSNIRYGKEVLLTAREVQIGFRKFVLSEHIGVHVTQVFDNVGDGVVHLVFWNTGMVILTWDGRSQIDVNIFCENTSVMKALQGDVEESFRTIDIKLRDFHPRGYGRVVNFAEDLEDVPKPRWA